MRSNDSFSYEKSSQYRQSYQNTAAKSPQKRRVDQTQQYTPTRFTKKPSERVSQLKDSINRCIETMSNKKQLNRQALEEVKMVNRQISQHLSNQGSIKNYKSNERKTDYNYDQPQYHRTDYAPRNNPRSEKQRDNVTLSSFHLNPTVENVGHINQFQTSEVYRPESLSSNVYQVQQLKQRIKAQRLQNQNLQRQVQALQREQRQMIENPPNFGYQQQDPYLVEENYRLRAELERMGSSSNANAIYEQFKQLKEDNQKLRNETISLLKNGRY